MRIIIFKLLTVITVYFGISQSYAIASYAELKAKEVSGEYSEFSGSRKLIFSQNYFDNSSMEEELSEMEIKVGEVVTFQAEPNQGYFFSHWAVNGQKVSENPEFQYTMPNMDVEIIGHFKLLVAPQIKITSPLNNATFESNKTVPIKLDASSQNGNITKVELFRNGIIVGTASDPRTNFSFTNLQIGSYTFTAKVTDERGMTAVSPEVRIQVVKPNVPPAVQIISPSNGSTFPEGTDVRIEAEALDSDGSISKVEFYRGSILIGTVTAPPYVAVLPKAAAGSYTITARAFDDKNVSTNSSAINILITKPNQLPTVTITSPKNADKFIEGTDVRIEANAADSDGTITKVEFYRGSTLIGTATTSPYSVNWSKPAVGNYALTAKAFDNKNATRTSSVVNIVIEKANVAPVVSLTSPNNGQVFIEGTDVKIEASASDSDGSITKVEFYRGTTLIGTSTTAPYSIIWNKPPVGNHNITARAFDNKNASTLSSPRKITVEKPNQLPVVLITSPKNGDKFIEGSNVKIDANASDQDGSIVKVEFYRGSTLIGTATTAPYTVTLSKPAAGNYSLTAKAFDNKNATKVSSAVNIIIEKPNILPEVSIVSPKNGDVFVEGSDIKIEANASDPDGNVTRVEFFRGSTRIGTATTAPYIITWSKATIGNHTLTAKVFDDRNGTTVSAPVNIVVEKANVPPTITITSPKTGSRILEGSTVKIQVNASDSDGRITKVEFFRGSTLIGTSTVAPFVETWSNVELGTYTLTAKAFDDKGASRMSAPVTVTVLPEQIIPEIEIISPFRNQSFDAGEVVGFTVMFRGNSEHVRRVDYYSGDQLIGSSTVNPFNFDWKNATSGEHIVKAVAVGGFPQKENISQEVNINVKFIPFEIVNPIKNSTYPTGSDLQIMVQLPNDSDKKIKRVEYFRGNQLLGSNGKAPYSFIWSNGATSEDLFNIGANIYSVQISDNLQTPKISMEFKAFMILCTLTSLLLFSKISSKLAKIACLIMPSILPFIFFILSILPSFFCGVYLPQIF
jgi:predicted thioesterase